ncbi:MAG: hypothetical protein OEU91_06995 [Gammaproteobacteria bacterium]|nr:hypothetical protein [Gammaproteobacteria bacterium]
MRILSIFLLILSLFACTAGSGYRPETGSAPFPGLSSVTLNREFHIRPDRASEYIQYGEIKPRNKVVEYYPHCIFELRSVSDQSRTVKPETFTVTGLHRDRYMAGFRELKLAFSGGGDYNMVMSTTTISLGSTQQPDVFRLSCKQLDEPYLARHVSVKQMRKTLDDLFTLE